VQLADGSKATLVLVSAVIDENACREPDEHGPILSFLLLPQD